MEFMKMYERYEAPSGGRGCFSKILKFCLYRVVFHVHFASSSSYIHLCEAFGRVSGGVPRYFMNLMKMYEGGLFKAIFQKRAVFAVEVMKERKGAASYIFINSMEAAI